MAACHIMLFICLIGGLLIKRNEALLLKHCSTTGSLARLIEVRVSPPNNSMVTQVRIVLRSAYLVNLEIRRNHVPRGYSYNDRDAGLKLTNYRNNDRYTYDFLSQKPVPLNLLSVDMKVDNPCNEVGLTTSVRTLMIMYQNGATYFPSIDVMPRKGYMLDRGRTYEFRTGASVVNEKELEIVDPRREGIFMPYYRWHKTRQLKMIGEVGGPQVSDDKAKIEFRNWTSTNNYGSETYTWEMSLKVMAGFPVDGVVMISNLDFSVPEARDNLQVYLYSTFQFPERKTLPMRVQLLSYGDNVSAEEFYRMRSNVKFESKKSHGFDMFTLGLNRNISAGGRGFSCFVVGFEKAPSLVVGILPKWQGQGGITDAKQVDVIYSGSDSMMGPLTVAQVKVDLPLGEEAFYICSASNGEEVRSSIVKVISILPVRVRSDGGTWIGEKVYQETCTASGYPLPDLKVFVVPSSERRYDGSDGYQSTEETYRKYEVPSNIVNVTTSSLDSTVHKTVSFDVDFLKEEYDDNGFYLLCSASNVNDGDILDKYIIINDNSFQYNYHANITFEYY